MCSRTVCNAGLVVDKRRPAVVETREGDRFPPGIGRLVILSSCNLRSVPTGNLHGLELLSCSPSRTESDSQALADGEVETAVLSGLEVGWGFGLCHGYIFHATPQLVATRRLVVVVCGGICCRWDHLWGEAREFGARARIATEFVRKRDRGCHRDLTALTAICPLAYRYLGRIEIYRTQRLLLGQDASRAWLDRLVPARCDVCCHLT